jgi:hypothetical protein
MNCPARSVSRAFFLVTACWNLSPHFVSAQYYESQEYSRSDARFVTVGAVWRQFRPRPSNSLPDSLASRFDRVMPMIGFRQGPVQVYFGYTTFMEQEQSREAIVLGTEVSTDFPLFGAGFPIVLPLMIAADYSKVEAAGLQRDNFNIGSIGIGVGLKFRSVGPSVEFWIQGFHLFQLSFEGIAAGTGSSQATIGEATLLLPRVPIADGIVLTYRIRLQTWSMKNDRFDYRSFYHGPSVGIMF